MFELVSKRRAVRSFKNEQIPKEDIIKIMETVLRMPSTRNMQLSSFIIIEDKEKLETIANIAGGQKHIANASAFILVLGDMNKLVRALEKTGEDFSKDFSSTSIMTDMFSDAGIAVSLIDLLGNKLGYASTIIGGVHSDRALEFSELLNLPKYTFPILGITLGIPTEKVNINNLKPRVDFENVVFFEKYDEEKAIKGVLDYDIILKEYFEKNNLKLASHLEVFKMYINSLKERDGLKELFEKQGFRK